MNLASAALTPSPALAAERTAISCYTHALEEDNFPVPEEHFEVMVIAV